MLRKFVYALITVLLVPVIFFSKPGATSGPGPSREDPAHEDLSRVEYPSLAVIPWEPRFIRPQDTMEKLFGRDWIYVARFNRIDRRHVYPGMTIKVPKDMERIRGYTPLPVFYEPAKRYEKFILIDQTEQWLGAYEYGRLKFSMPAATGMDGHNTPNGLFQVDARDKNHTSSLYKTEDQEEQYPMDNAIRFHVGTDNVSYWIHARDLPGRPASHGCVGVYDEEMQNRQYGIPDKPVLKESEKLYNWAVGEDEYEDDPGESEELEDGPMVEVRGENPRYLKQSFFAFLGKN